MIGQKGYPPVHGGIEKHVAELARAAAGAGLRGRHLQPPPLQRRRRPDRPARGDASGGWPASPPSTSTPSATPCLATARRPGASRRTSSTTTPWGRACWPGMPALAGPQAHRGDGARTGLAARQVGRRGPQRAQAGGVGQRRAARPHHRRLAGPAGALPGRSTGAPPTYIPNGIAPPVYRAAPVIREPGHRPAVRPLRRAAGAGEGLPPAAGGLAPACRRGAARHHRW